MRERNQLILRHMSAKLQKPVVPSTAVPPPKPPRPPKPPTPMELATLAVMLLPRLEFAPAIRGSITSAVLDQWSKERVGELLDQMDPLNTKAPYLLPWELACEEALRRAKTLLLMAQGVVRPAVLEHWDALERRLECVLNDGAKHLAQQVSADFPSNCSVAGFVEFFLPDASYREAYYRAWLRQKGPKFEFLGKELDQRIPIAAYSFIRDAGNSLLEFVEEKGEALRKKWERENKRKGGKTKNIKEKAAAAAAYEENIRKKNLFGTRTPRRDVS